MRLEFGPDLLLHWKLDQAFGVKAELLPVTTPQQPGGEVATVKAGTAFRAATQCLPSGSLRREPRQHLVGVLADARQWLAYAESAPAERER